MALWWPHLFLDAGSLHAGSWLHFDFRGFRKESPHALPTGKEPEAHARESHRGQNHVVSGGNCQDFSEPSWTRVSGTGGRGKWATSCRHARYVVELPSREHSPEARCRCRPHPFFGNRNCLLWKCPIPRSVWGEFDHRGAGLGRHDRRSGKTQASHHCNPPSGRCHGAQPTNCLAPLAAAGGAHRLPWNVRVPRLCGPSDSKRVGRGVRGRSLQGLCARKRSPG